MPTADEFAIVLEQLIDLGRVIINQGLSLRRALDNQSPPQFEGSLAAYVKLDAKLIHIEFGGNAFEGLFDQPAGEELTESGRSEWVKGRLTVIRELANLDIDTLAWTRGAEEVIAKSGGLDRVDPALAARYRAVADEIRKLRAWTVPAGKFAKGYITPPASGSFMDRIAGIVGRVGIDLDGLMKLLDGVKSLAGLALVVVGLYFLWRLFRS